MPVLDMPLSELKKYKGTNPCPPDLDEYWDIAIEEMNNVAPEIELIPINNCYPTVECFDLYFTGVKGARIYAKYVRPKVKDKPAPALIEFHGYSAKSADWASLLSYAGQGYCVAALDCRGQGGRSSDLGGVTGNTLNGHIIRGLQSSDAHELLFRHIFLDTAQLAKIVMNFAEVDENRVTARGGSQGGGLALACAALEPKISKVSSLFPFLSDYQRVWEMDLAKDAYDELTRYFRNFDPLHEREKETFTKLGYIDVKNLAKRIKADVLMGITQMDNICPPSTQFAAYNNILSNKKYVLYPDFGHEWPPGFGDIEMNFILTN